MRFAVLIVFSFILLLGFTSSAEGTNEQTFQAKGVVVGLDFTKKAIEIRHEAIPGYMPAMTMPFDVKDTNELSGLKTNDSVSFQLVVTATNGWVGKIQKIAGAATDSASTAKLSQAPPAVEPISEGDLLPDFTFTNQFGARFGTKEFKGHVFAITFLFTRCPFPNYCPRMADNFGAAQKKLLALTNAPADWHLLTISFDPAFDTPEVLKNYAEFHGADPQRWTFATGTLENITGISQQLGLTFWRDETGSFNHNLRTAVIGASGRVEKIFIGNDWAPEDLVAEMLKAASR